MSNLTGPPASQGAELAEIRERDANIMATFPDLQEARTAIEELGRAGIEGQRVTLRGPGADEAAEQSRFQSPRDNAAADGRLIGRWASRVAVAAGIGAVFGALLGIPVGIVALEIIGEDVTWGTVIASAFFGALFLSTIFGLLAHVYQLPGQPHAWELTFQDTEGQAVVGVHSQAQDDITKARGVFEQLGALDIREVSAGRSARPTVESIGQGR
jgi:hypothetical protein